MFRPAPNPTLGRDRIRSFSKYETGLATGVKWQGIGDKQLSRWSCAAPLLTFHLKGHFSLNIIFSVDNLNKVRFILLNFPGFPGDTFVRRDITS